MTFPALAILLAQATHDTPAWVVVIVLVQFALSAGVTVISIIERRAAAARERADAQAKETLTATIEGVAGTLSAKLDGVSREVGEQRKRDAHYERMFEALRERDRQIELAVLNRLTAIETHMANHHSFRRPQAGGADGGAGHD